MQFSTFALTAALVTVSFAAEAISQITDGQIQAGNSTATVAEANGAARLSGSFAAAGLAAAALLL